MLEHLRHGLFDGLPVLLQIHSGGQVVAHRLQTEQAPALRRCAASRWLSWLAIFRSDRPPSEAGWCPR
jgi:hypothetical protein